MKSDFYLNDFRVPSRALPLGLVNGLDNVIYNIKMCHRKYITYNRKVACQSGFLAQIDMVVWALQ